MSEPKKEPGFCANRREFLLAGGVSAALITIGQTSMPALARVKGYPKERIIGLDELTEGEPYMFNYPDENSKNLLVKLGVIAGGGVGPGKDVVAFNSLCSHMGGKMAVEQYKHKDKAYGPCPHHLSTFDLTKHGMVISGHATQSLPQIQLEVSGNTIYAVGALGLLYGRASNLGPQVSSRREPEAGYKPGIEYKPTRSRRA